MCRARLVVVMLARRVPPGLALPAVIRYGGREYAAEIIDVTRRRLRVRFSTRRRSNVETWLYPVSQLAQVRHSRGGQGAPERAACVLRLEGAGVKWYEENRQPLSAIQASTIGDALDVLAVAASESS